MASSSWWPHDSPSVVCLSEFVAQGDVSHDRIAPSAPSQLPKKSINFPPFLRWDVSLRFVLPVPEDCWLALAFVVYLHPYIIRELCIASFLQPTPPTTLGVSAMCDDGDDAFWWVGGAASIPSCAQPPYTQVGEFPCRSRYAATRSYYLYTQNNNPPCFSLELIPFETINTDTSRKVPTSLLASNRGACGWGGEVVRWAPSYCDLFRGFTIFLVHSHKSSEENMFSFK